MQDALAGRLRASGLPALRPRPDARGAALRHRAALELRGDPIPLGEGLGVGDLGLVSFSALDDRRRSPTAPARRRPAARVDRPQGQGEARPRPGRASTRTRGSPPTAAASSSTSSEDNNKGDLWIRDFARGTTTRFTFEPEREFAPVWSPDGKRIAYSACSDKALGPLLEGRRRDGRAGAPAGRTTRTSIATDWSRDGTTIVFSSRGETNWDLWAMRMTGDRKPSRSARRSSSELNGTLSPDGRFLAYQSNESGRNESTCRSSRRPGASGRSPPNGGREPSWRADGRELYYRAPDAQLDGRADRDGAAFATGTPQPLFLARFAPINARSLYRPRPTASASWYSPRRDARQCRRSPWC